jgi:hypothetical protein
VSDNDEQTEQLALPGQRITVTLNDGSQFAVQVANRDYLAWDMTAPKKGWDNDTQKMLFHELPRLVGGPPVRPVPRPVRPH